MQLFVLHYSKGKIILTVSSCSIAHQNLGYIFALFKWKIIRIISYNVQLLVKFCVTLLFDTKIEGVCTIHATWPEIKGIGYLFSFWSYWGLCHNWDIHNAFVFDSRHNIRAYLQNLKGVLMWKFCWWSVRFFSPKPLLRIS